MAGSCVLLIFQNGSHRVSPPTKSFLGHHDGMRHSPKKKRANARSLIPCKSVPTRFISHPLQIRFNKKFTMDISASLRTKNARGITIHACSTAGEGKFHVFTVTNTRLEIEKHPLRIRMNHTPIPSIKVWSFTT